MTRKRNKMSELPTIKTVQIKPGEVVNTSIDESITSVSAMTGEVAETHSTKSRSDFATLTLPYITAVVTGGFQEDAFRIDLKRITRKRLLVAKALRRGFIAEGITTADGYEVKTNSDAIYCLLDLLSAKMDLSETQ